MPAQRDARDLGHDEINRILSLIDQFDKSGLSYLRLETGDLKLILSKGGLPEAFQDVPVIPTKAISDTPREPLAPAAGQASTPVPAEPATAQDGVVPILAPMLGRFYVAPEPGASPFVSVGSRVEEDTTVGLIEVMKVFNAVKAGVKGVVTRICVEDGQFIEYGQTLFLVQTEAAAGNGT